MGDFDEDGDVDMADIIAQYAADNPSASDGNNPQKESSWSGWFGPKPTSQTAPGESDDDSHHIECHGRWAVAEELGFHKVKYMHFDDSLAAFEFFRRLGMISRVIYDPSCKEVKYKGANVGAFKTIRKAFARDAGVPPPEAGAP